MRPPLIVGVAIGMLLPGALLGQGYHLRVESRVQSAAYRGVIPDSVLSGDVVIGPTGGFVTAGGYAVSCQPGAAYCVFYRPGLVRRGGPWVTTADGTIWGLGVSGLSFHGTARIGLDLGETDVWPGTAPAVQLLDGYLEYAARVFTVSVGRTHVISRFGFTGFDGGKATTRTSNGMASVAVYGGWGLARGVALPVTSPALNPLDDYQPRDRQLIVGVDGGVRTDRAQGRLLYERQVDPRSDDFVSERVALEVALQPASGLSLTGGADYDLAFGQWGSAEATLGYRFLDGRVSGTFGARHYRPFFDLWTIWGVFSPVPYRSSLASIAVSPLEGVQLRARGETYTYEAADVSTPLVSVENGGWRWDVGATVTPRPDLSMHADYHFEHGTGASSRGLEGRVTWQPAPEVAIGLRGGSLKRPLEFRFDESNVWLVGGDVSYRVNSRFQLSAAVTRYAETRDRPDAAAFDWNQWRASGGVRLAFGQGADTRLPPAIMRIPSRDGDGQ